MPKTHELKTLPEYFDHVVFYRKKFEVRKNDRDFQVGDTLILKEYHPDTGYTGNWCGRTVTYILDDPEYVKDGFVILSIAS